MRGDGPRTFLESGFEWAVDGSSKRSAVRSVSRDRSVEAASGELAAEDVQSVVVAQNEAWFVWRREGTPEAGSEFPRT